METNKKTYEWYEKAANNGNDIAMFRIAYMYYTGEEGKEKDLSKAILFQKVCLN